MKLIAGNSNMPLARAIADYLEIPLTKATEESLALIDGLNELLRPAGAPFDYAAPFLRGTPESDTDGVHEIVIGGVGSDVVEGRGGNDYLDGDAMLRVQLVHTPTGERFDSAAQVQARVFTGEINPGDLDIVREIVIDDDDARFVLGDQVAIVNLHRRRTAQNIPRRGRKGIGRRRRLACGRQCRSDVAGRR